MLKISLPYYLIHSFGEKRWILTFLKDICLTVNIKNLGRIWTQQFTDIFSATNHYTSWIFICKESNNFKFCDAIILTSHLCSVITKYFIFEIQTKIEILFIIDKSMPCLVSKNKKLINYPFLPTNFGLLQSIY